jgi:hypothetical protein
MKEALEIDADKRTNGSVKHRKELNRIFNCIESLSEQNCAEWRPLVKCELVRSRRMKKSNNKKLAIGTRGFILEECD